MWLCWTVVALAKQEPLLCFITSERPQTPQVTAPDGPQKWLPNCLDFPFPLHLAGKLPLEGGWWQQHTHQAGGMSWWTQMPNATFLWGSLAGPQRSEERGGGGMKSGGIQGIHSHPVPQRWGVAAYPPNSGHVLSSLQPEFSFKEPKMHHDNTCSKVFEPAYSVLNKEIILLLPPENPESTKGRQGSRRQEQRMQIHESGVFVLTHISPPSRHFSAFIFIAEVF